MSNSVLCTKNFRVPKLKSKEFLELVNLETFKTEICPRLIDSYIKPKESENNFKFINSWLINNAEAEQRYMKRRQMMRKENPSATESIGFLYVKSKEDLLNLAKSGQICVGNITNSCLATSEMGISVCQHADIFHHGYPNIPKHGIIVIVKYYKGRINFVQFDKNPMEPQPHYDCHMVKSYPSFDKNCSIFKVFHMTQVLIYEYNEDGDICKYPSQILPLAAAEFQWCGGYLYRSSPLTNKPKPVENTWIERPVIVATVDRKQLKSRQRIESVDKSVFKKDSTCSFPCQLALYNCNDQNCPELKISSIVYMYMSNPVIFPQLYTPLWKISSVIEITDFENGLKQFQIRLQDKITSIPTDDLIDPLSKTLIISTNSPTLLTFYGNKVNEPFLLSNDITIPKFMTYLRVVPDDSNEQQTYAARLIDHFNNSKTVAQISLGSMNNQHSTILFIFPDGKLSQRLGIHSLETKGLYFHGLLLHFQQPEFTLCNLSKTSCEEKSIYFNGLSSYRKQAVHAKLSSSKPIIDLNILKETSKDQGTIQKDLFKNILKLNTTKYNLSYSKLSFERKQASISDIPPENSSTKDSALISKDCNISSKTTEHQTILDGATIQEKTVKTKNNHNNKNLLSEKLRMKGSSLPIIININSKNSLFHTAGCNESHKPLNGVIRKEVSRNAKRRKLSEKKKVLKRKISDVEAANLKTGLYNALKKHLSESNLTSLAGSNSELTEIESDPVPITNADDPIIPVSYTEIDIDEDLVPIRKHITPGLLTNGRFNEVIFLNECFATIANTNKLWCIRNTHIGQIGRNSEYQKMWSLNRCIFRKVKHLPGVSVYQGL